MMGSIFFEVTLIICLSSFLAIVFRFFKQPAILAYILTGILIGPFGQLQLNNQEVLTAMGDFGIALLLFILGLEFKFKELRSVSKTAVFIGPLQIIVTSIVFYFITLFLGFSSSISFYVGITFAFSSTIIIVTLLTDKREINSLHGKMTIGMLLIQDIAAVFALIIISELSSSSEILVLLPSILLKSVIVFTVLFGLSVSFLPYITHKLAYSLDILFLFSLAWVFSVTSFINSSFIGFPIAIGGFLAGLSLANSIESLQIAARIRTLRDFFITIFFVSLGMQMEFSSLEKVLFPALILSFAVFFGKPLITLFILQFFGYHKRTAFLTAITMGQISEFSLVILFLGKQFGHISSEVVSLVTIVCVVTFILSTYAIGYSKRIYIFVSNYLFTFAGGKIPKPESDLDDIKNHVVLIGAHRIGESILEALRQENERVVVVDFNPDIIAGLKKKGISHVFGDISDSEIQERLKIQEAKIIISTVPDMEDNLLLLEGGRALKRGNTLFIVIAKSREEAKALYKAGADYVVLPDLIGGIHIANLLKENTTSKIVKLREKDKEALF